jgi:hypothetical protein
MKLRTEIVLSNQFCKYYMLQLTETNEKLACEFVFYYFKL